LIVNILDQRVWKLTTAVLLLYTLSKSALWNSNPTMAQALRAHSVNAIGGPGRRSQ